MKYAIESYLIPMSIILPSEGVPVTEGFGTFVKGIIDKLARAARAAFDFIVNLIGKHIPKFKQKKPVQQPASSSQSSAAAQSSKSTVEVHYFAKTADRLCAQAIGKATAIALTLAKLANTIEDPKSATDIVKTRIGEFTRRDLDGSINDAMDNSIMHDYKALKEHCEALKNLKDNERALSAEARTNVIEQLTKQRDLAIKSRDRIDKFYSKYTKSDSEVDNYNAEDLQVLVKMVNKYTECITSLLPVLESFTLVFD